MFLIVCGNHYQFGNYGFQMGDGKGLIANKTVSFLETLK
ncbi:hypothetical protein [endosymbiont 'TC1' of Trimyema compressum]